MRAVDGISGLPVAQAQGTQPFEGLWLRNSIRQDEVRSGARFEFENDLSSLWRMRIEGGITPIEVEFLPDALPAPRSRR